MGFLKYIQNIRENKTDMQKNKISLYLSLVITIIIAFAWYFTLFTKSVYQISEVSNEDSPLTSLVNNVKGILKNKEI